MGKLSSLAAFARSAYHVDFDAARAFSRPTVALQSFSDVFPKDGDSDALLTTKYRHLNVGDSHGFGVSHPLEAAYGVELMSQLIDDVREQVWQAGRDVVELLPEPISNSAVGDFLMKNAARFGLTHPNLRQAEAALDSGATRVIGNWAPRVERGVSGKNGTDFYVAILKNGLEVYATPLSILSFVRNDVKFLARIPNEGHPLFDGDHEQYRSSIVARSCEVPWHLVPAYPSEIPDFDGELVLTYVDKFGNQRLRAGDSSRIQSKLHSCTNDSGVVGVKVNGYEARPAHRVAALDEIPLGEFGIYGNVADGDNAAYLELVQRWPSDNERVNGHETLGNPKHGSEISLVQI